MTIYPQFLFFVIFPDVMTLKWHSLTYVAKIRIFLQNQMTDLNKNQEMYVHLFLFFARKVIYWLICTNLHQPKNKTIALKLHVQCHKDSGWMYFSRTMSFILSQLIFDRKEEPKSTFLAALWIVTYE